MSYSKIAIRDTPKEPWKLFAIGVSKVIECWTMTMTSTGTIDIDDDYSVSLDKHTDYVLDIMVSSVYMGDCVCVRPMGVITLCLSNNLVYTLYTIYMHTIHQH